jgi:hypothetical protein
MSHAFVVAHAQPQPLPSGGVCWWQGDRWADPELYARKLGGGELPADLFALIVWGLRS